MMNHVRVMPNQIIWETEKAYLIKVPKSNRWKFWVPKKLMQWNKNSYMMAIFSDRKIKLFSDAGNQKLVDPEDFMSLFGFDWDNTIVDDLLDEE